MSTKHRLIGMFNTSKMICEFIPNKKSKGMEHKITSRLVTGSVMAILFLGFPSTLNTCLQFSSNIFLKFLIGLTLHTGFILSIALGFIQFFKRIDLNENHPLRKYRISEITVENAQAHYSKMLPNYKSFIKVYLKAIVSVYTVSFWSLYYFQLLDFQFGYFRNALMLITSLVLSDLWYYLLHRLSHNRYLYAPLHKTHHEYFNVTVMSNFHASFCEYFVFDIPTAVLGWMTMLPFIGPVTPEIITLSYAALLMDQLVAHSGYDLPFWIDKVISGLSESRFHYFHHRINQGSFGALFGAFDRMFGTYNLYFDKIKKT